MTNKVLVTGAGGFVGGFVVDALLARGEGVRAMVHSRERCGALDPERVELVEGDLRNRASLDEAVQGVTKIYHIASLFRQAGLPDDVFRDVNAEGTRRLFDAAIAAKVKRIVHCSTVGVLGHIESPPADETTPYNPGDIYQQTKLEGEQIALEYFRSGRIPGVVIRPAMIYGPGDDRTLKLFRMIARKCFFYVGRGDTLVHFIDVRDLAQAFLLAMDHEERNGEIYIIAGAAPVPLKNLANLVAEKLQVPRPWLHLPVRPMQWLGSACEAICTPLHIPPPIFRRRVDFYTKSRAFDSRKAREQLGFSPAQDLEGELKDILSAYQSAGRL